MKSKRQKGKAVSGPQICPKVTRDLQPLFLQPCNDDPSQCHPLASANYPNNYPNNHNDNVVLEFPENYIIKFEFTDFAVEYQRYCLYDWITIYDYDTGKVILPRTCGNSIPRSFSTHNLRVQIRFHSDFSVAMKGFKLKLTAAKVPSYMLVLAIGNIGNGYATESQSSRLGYYKLDSQIINSKPVWKHVEREELIYYASCKLDYNILFYKSNLYWVYSRG